jgi:hypothetical protein
VHDAVEAATDQAAARPWNGIGAVGLAEVADVLLPLARVCAAALDEVIPVGRLQPTGPDTTAAHHRGQPHDLETNPAERLAGQRPPSPAPISEIRQAGAHRGILHPDGLRRGSGVEKYCFAAA